MTVERSRLRRGKLELVSAGARLGGAALILPGEGNLSILVPGCEGFRVLMTPRAADKARLAPGEVVEVPWRMSSRGEWRRVEIPPNASTEARMHLAIYEECPGTTAVVHAHPPHLLSLAMRRLVPDSSLLDEGNHLLGGIAWVASAAPGSVHLAQEVATASLNAPACVLERHGAVTRGSSLEEALKRMLLLDRLAELTLEQG